jgi:hypothetical protein
LSEASDEDFEAVLENLQPRLVSAVQKFAKVLYESGASTRIVGDEQRLALTIDDVGRLSRRLSEVEIIEEVEVRHCSLAGIAGWPVGRQLLQPSREARS